MCSFVKLQVQIFFGPLSRYFSIKVRVQFVNVLRYIWIQECAAAFVFFKTRYAAVAAFQVLQLSNPMFWVTDLAPEPHDIYWSNLWIPYRQLWIRKMATLEADIAFMHACVSITFVKA